MRRKVYTVTLENLRKVLLNLLNPRNSCHHQRLTVLKILGSGVPAELHPFWGDQNLTVGRTSKVISLLDMLQ